MRKQKFLTVVCIFLFIGQAIPLMAQETTVEPFLGRWAFDLGYNSSNVGWLEVRQEDGYIDADVLWRWGSVYPVDFVFIEQDHLFIIHNQRVVRKKDDSGKPVRIQQQVYWFDITKNGDDKLEGMAFFPNQNGIGIESVTISGKKIPEHDAAPDLEKIKFGKPVKLFNGKDLTGWELLEENATNGWKVVDGILVNDPVHKAGEQQVHYGNLRTTNTFEDFNLKLEVNVPKGSNSGIYLRGIYEVQVLDSYGRALDSHNMGGLYSRITPSEEAEKPAGEWQEMDITLCKRYLTVILNGKKIIDNQPVMGVTGGAMISDEFVPGPIYLQGDHGKVSYRNITLTPIIH